MSYYTLLNSYFKLVLWLFCIIYIYDINMCVNVFNSKNNTSYQKSKRFSSLDSIIRGLGVHYFPYWSINMLEENTLARRKGEEIADADHPDSISEIKGLSHLMVQTDTSTKATTGSQRRLSIIHIKRPHNIWQLINKHTVWWNYETWTMVVHVCACKCFCVCVCARVCVCVCVCVCVSGKEWSTEDVVK